MKKLSLYWLLALSLIIGFAGCAGGEDEEEPLPVEDQMDEEGMQQELEQDNNLGQFDQENMDNQMAVEQNEQPVQQEVPQQAVETPPEISDMDRTPCYFAFDDYSLNMDSQENLRAKAEWLKNNANSTFTIEGHCDERGSNQYNLALGERRAHSTKMFLVNQGVSSDRISIISYGEEKPVDSGHNEVAWAKNRRTEFLSK